MDVSGLYVLRDEPCKQCHGDGMIYSDSLDVGGHYCRCTFSGGGVGVTQVQVPLVDALRSLGIEVPEPENDIADRSLIGTVTEQTGILRG